MAAQPGDERPRSVGRAIGNFAIGTVAGLTSVFLPRMMLLLSVESEPAPQRYITLFAPDFVWLGLAFGLAIGIIATILEHEAGQKPREVFMAALGIPALVSGVLHTTGATNKLQKVEQEKVAILRTMIDQAGVSVESVNSIAPLEGPGTRPDGGRSSSSRRPFLTLVDPAFAQSTTPAQQSPRFDPGIQIHRPSYVLLLKRASSQDEAVRLAKELQKDVPTAQAVTTNQGYFVVDSLTPRSEADALLDAIQLKSKKKLNPALLQVPGSPGR